MAQITQQDLFVVEAARMSAAADSGGLPSRRVVSNHLNALFPPVSDVDNTVGRVNMRKVFAGVKRNDTAPLYGAHFALIDPPDHANISIIAFKATQYGDTREEARRRLEAYSVATIEAPMVLMSTQQTGSRLVQAYQALTDAQPNDGEVFCLRQDKSGYPFLEQYFRITDIKSEIRRFHEVRAGRSVSFVKRVLTMEVSEPLLHDFEGMEYPEESSRATCPVKILETQVSDSAVYHGVMSLASDITATDQTVTVDSIYGQLVPTSRAEKAVIDHKPTASPMWIPLGSARPVSNGVGGSGNIYFDTGVMPGSVDLAGHTDNADGTLIHSGGNVLTVDYAQGVIFNAPSRPAVTAVPATEVSGASHTSAVPITIANQGTEWAPFFDPIPAKGSLTVEYVVLGKWYRLHDDGTGNLTGKDGTGGGHLSFATGSSTVSLGALPDVGSRIIFSWSTTKLFRRLDNEPLSSTASFTPQSKALPVLVQLKPFAKAGTLNITWTDTGGTARSAAETNGVVSGDATGNIDYVPGRLLLQTAHTPDANGFSVAYQRYTTTSSVNLTFTDSGTNITATLPDTPLSSTLSIEIQGKTAAPNVHWIIGKFNDRGSGDFIAQYGALGHAEVGGITQAGTALTIDKSKIKRADAGITYADRQIDAQANLISLPDSYTVVGNPLGTTTHLTAAYATASSPTTAEVYPSTGAVTAPQKTVVLMDNKPDAARLLVGSLHLRLNGEDLFDRGGELFKNIDSTTGAGERVGSVDYAAIAVILDHAPAADLPLEILSGVVVMGDWSANRLQGLTPSAPVKPGTFSIRGENAADSSAAGYVGNSALDGSVSGGLVGTLDHETGFYDVTVSGRIAPESVRVNFTSYRFLPSNSSVTGIDATRLPADGRVPLIRKGDMVLISHAERFALPGALTAGQTITLPRQNLDRVCVLDANNQHVYADHYNIDLSTGVLTMVDDIDLSSYQLPLTAVVRKAIANPTPGATVNTGMMDTLIHVIDAANTAIDTALYSVNTTTGAVTFANPLDVSAYTAPFTAESRQPLGSSFTGGVPVSVSGSGLDSLQVVDNAGTTVASTLFTRDLSVGSVTFNAALDLSGYALPLTAVHTIEKRNRVTELNINGELKLQFPIGKDFPAAGSYVSSVLLGGDLQAITTHVFSQRTWTHEWKNERTGDPILSQFNDAAYPIILTGRGAIKERWALRFTGPTTYEVYGETVGLVANGDIYTDLSVTNAEGEQYLRIDHRAFGGGWGAGNVVRFNTEAADRGIWLVRATTPSPTAIVDIDGFTLCVRGNTINDSP